MRRRGEAAMTQQGDRGFALVLLFPETTRQPQSHKPLEPLHKIQHNRAESFLCLRVIEAIIKEQRDFTK